MTILLDPGHGSDTPGKRSPDGHFREYAYNRYLAIEIRNRLAALGLDTIIITPEQEDIPLLERCRRANSICKEIGTNQVILLSIHINAARNGNKWINARGWKRQRIRNNFYQPGEIIKSIRISAVWTSIFPFYFTRHRLFRIFSGK